MYMCRGHEKGILCLNLQLLSLGFVIMGHSRAPLCLSYLWNTARSRHAFNAILHRIYTSQWEWGHRRQSTVKVGVGQLTGRGNRRPEVIGDVINRGRKSISKEGICGNSIQLVRPSTNVEQEKFSVGSTENKIKVSLWGSSVDSLSV